MLTYSSDIKELAKAAAGNWQRFDSFVWWERPENAEAYTLVYTDNRDSDSIDRANAIVIREAMRPFIGRTVIEQSHSHWACGSINGYAIRVYDRRGRITKAFRTWVELQQRMEDYPALDEGKLSEVESNDEDEAWDSWAHSEFRRGLEKRFGCEFRDGSDLREAFESARDVANEYWIHESSGPYIDIAKVVAAVSEDSISDMVEPRTVVIRRNGDILVTGSLTLNEWQCDMPLYEREFSICMVADAAGETSVVIDGATYTWAIE